MLHHQLLGVRDRIVSASQMRKARKGIFVIYLFTLIHCFCKTVVHPLLESLKTFQKFISGSKSTCGIISNLEVNLMNNHIFENSYQ
jgi:hypothetical protein